MSSQLGIIFTLAKAIYHFKYQFMMWKSRGIRFTVLCEIRKCDSAPKLHYWVKSILQYCSLVENEIFSIAKKFWYMAIRAKIERRNLPSAINWGIKWSKRWAKNSAVNKVSTETEFQLKLSLQLKSEFANLTEFGLKLIFN